MNDSPENNNVNNRGLIKNGQKKHAFFIGMCAYTGFYIVNVNAYFSVVLPIF